MTNSQQKILESLEANRQAALAVGLNVQMDTEDHGRFVSVAVRVQFGHVEGPRRLGHDQELYSHFLIGKRGRIEGLIRTGSKFSEGTTYSKGNIFGTNEPQIFDMMMKNGLAYAFQSMIETAQNMAELNKEVAA